MSFHEKGESNMALRTRNHRFEQRQHVQPSYPVDNDSNDNHRPNVLVTYGIHRGRYPVAGMRVCDARRVLQNLINIDPEALPVINGLPVDEEEVISEEVTMVSFVKHSSMKG
jgi:hypothetical protein